jgi:long-chain fatty acid transport protein
MNPYKHCPKIGCATVALTLAGGSAFGSGYDLPDVDAFAVGRGLAVTATADDPSAVFYNPAGLTQLTGNNVRAGFYGISLQPQFKNPNTGATFGNQESFSAIPQFFYSYGNAEHGYSLGLGVYAPAGLSLQWPDTTGFRTVATKGSLEQFAINPVAAYKLLDTLSIGGGLSANYANLDLRQGILWPGQPFDQFRFQGDGWSLAGNAGILWQPIKQLSFGAAVQSGTKTDLKGYTSAYNDVATPLPTAPYYYPKFATRTGAQADFQFPFKAEAGVSYRPTPNWNLEFDADYIDWDSVGNLNIQQSSAFPPLFPKDLPLALGLQSSWYYELGVTRYFDCGWHVSVGYIFNQNSASSSHYVPLIADEDRHFFSAGLGYQGKHLSLDIAYQFGYGPDRTVTGSAPAATGQSADGIYSFISHAVAVSMGWHF